MRSLLAVQRSASQGLEFAASARMEEIQRYGLHRRLAARWGRGGDALWTLLASAILLGINGSLALAIGKAALLASLGPTIFQLLERPLAGASSPRSTVLAHAVALVVGYGILAGFGLRDAPSIMEAGVDVGHALAAVASLAVTGGVLLAVGLVHPPAGSTALLVSMGFVRQPSDLLLAEVGIVAVVASAVALNRAAGIPVPLWSAPRSRSGHAPES